MKIVTLPGVYPPSEDTFFLASYLERYAMRGKRVLDMGTGSGYLAVLSALKGAHVVASDIQPRAVLNARLNARLNRVRITTVLSDLFEHVRGVFDIIVFNPPYLSPWEDVTDVSWDGGAPVVLRFLEEVESYLHPDGRYLFVMEEDEEWRKIERKLTPECTSVRKNAFHLVIVEGRPCR